ncbi:MAG: hypothetical protein RR075_06495 [Pygmaiobacter sp.]
MKKEKNLLLTFCFACCPGAGQMYMGYLKRGVSLMLLFFSIFGICGFFRIWIFAVVLPAIWFVAFFDTFTLRSLGAEERARRPDDFLFTLPDEMKRQSAGEWAKRYHLGIGILLIFIGSYAIYNDLIMPFIGRLLDSVSIDLWWLWNIMYQLPSFCVAVIVILIGIRLVRGEKKKPSDDMVEFKGEHTDD